MLTIRPPSLMTDCNQTGARLVVGLFSVTAAPHWLSKDGIENISCKCCTCATLLQKVMPSKVYSAAVVGVDAFEVEIEVHAGWGNPDKIAVVGLPDTAVKESKDRVTSAITNSALRWPSSKRITINLAPADIRKEGPSFDLPIALGMLQAEAENRLPDLRSFCLTGELALSGRLRPVKGVLSIALE